MGEISTRPTNAAAIATAAVTCAENDPEREAIWVAMDLDELVHEATTLHGVMCLISRMARDGERLPTD